MAKVKICGITRREDIEIVNAEKPDYIGFVFAESRRKITLDATLKLRRELNGIIAVGVFVNAPIENIAEVIRSGAIDMVQLHGTEDDAYISRLKNLTDAPIIKANAYSQAADYLLFDSPNPGSGKVFDWDTIGKTEKPFFLAGGLNAENVREAIRKTAPFAVDVSSGVETNGVKNAAKIREFIRRAKHGE